MFPPPRRTRKNRHVKELRVQNFNQQLRLYNATATETHVMAYAAAAPGENVDLPYERASHTLQKDLNLACPTSTIGAVHYKPTEDREVQITQYTIVEDSEGFQRFA